MHRTIWLLVALLAAPTALAHGAPQILEVETLLIDDEAQDAFYVLEGYDVDDVYVREAYWGPFGQAGFVFRITLAGGPMATGEDHTIRLTIHSESDHVFSATTQDGATWEGDLRLTEAVPEGSDTYLMGFVAAQDIGAPAALPPVSVESLVGDRTVDVAPGGIFAGPAEIPTESQRLVESLDLLGPVGYVQVTPAHADGQIQVLVENNVSAGQHVFLRADPAWTAQTSHATGEIEEGGNITLHLSDLQAPSGEAQWVDFHVDTDLGGRETFSMYWNGQTFGSQESDGNDAPGLPLVGLLAALAIARRARK